MRTRILNPLLRGFLTVVALLLLSGWTAVVRAETPALRPSKYALLIGIDAYQNTDATPLEGAKNDIRLLKELLVSPQFGFPSKNVVELLDSNATHENIRAAFQALTQKIHPGDMAYIHYAGHGALTCDLNGDEKSGLDSTWVSYGSRQSERNPKSNPAGCDEAVKAAKLRPPASAPVSLNDYDVLDDELNRSFAANTHSFSKTQ